MAVVAGDVRGKPGRSLRLSRPGTTPGRPSITVECGTAGSLELEAVTTGTGSKLPRPPRRPTIKALVHACRKELGARQSSSRMELGPVLALKLEETGRRDGVVRGRESDAPSLPREREGGRAKKRGGNWKEREKVVAEKKRETKLSARLDRLRPTPKAGGRGRDRHERPRQTREAEAGFEGERPRPRPTQEAESETGGGDSCWGS